MFSVGEMVSKILFREKKAEDLERKIDAAEKFNVNHNQGLSTEQVTQRINEGLTNKTKKAVTMSYGQIIFKNLFSILNILLFTIAIVMIIFGVRSHQPFKITRLIFLGILILNITISLVQDIKARKLIDKLSLISNPKVSVVRRGIRKNIPFEELVLSDIIVLKAGNTIPCDAVVKYGFIRVNESMLSGEAEDVNKHINSKLYAESYVTSGFAYAQVVKVGSANYATKLQDKARRFARPQSEILISLTSIIRIISICAISIGIAEIITYSLVSPNDIFSNVDKVTSSLVTMIPIGMYLMTSVTLTVGVIILGRHNILVRELYSIEMLARVNILCLDKTGTLTDGNMTVNELVSTSRYKAQDLERIVSWLLYMTQDDNLTAKALKAKYPLLSVDDDYSAIPFSSENKFSAGSFGGHTYALGALGFMNIENEAIVKPVIRNYEKQGRRVMIIAEAHHNIIDNKLPKGLKAVGIVVLSENVKADAKKNIDWFKTSDVGIRIISGDSKYALQAVAREVGMEDYNLAISCDNLTGDELKVAALKYKIFGRVTPEQKRIIIQALRQGGNTVAMIGDGVNDLLALKAADCSIAMASGSDAPKAVSHLVSLDSNFSSLPKVVEEGRRVINNLQRVCSIFLVKTVFSITLALIYLSLLWGKTGATYPLVTNNLMAWELITIGIAPFFLALEPNKDRIKGRFIYNLLIEAVPAGLIQLVITLPLLISAQFSPCFDLDGAVAMSVISFTVMSLVILLHVSMPLNKYRKRVIVAAAVALLVFFCLDVLTYFKVSGESTFALLDIKYSKIDRNTAILGPCLFAVGIPIYFYTSKYVRRFIERFDTFQRNIASRIGERKNNEEGRFD